MATSLARLRRLRMPSLAVAVAVTVLPMLVSCASQPQTVAAPLAERRGVHAVPDAPLARLAQDEAPSRPPTWSTIYGQYFAASTEGGCGRSAACHASEMSDPGSAYAWLAQRGYIAGTQSPIASTTNSCLRWFGGNMPPRGTPNPRAASDLSAWVAAGAPNN